MRSEARNMEDVTGATAFHSVLLRFAEPEELEALRETQANRDAAETEARKLTEKAAELERRASTAGQAVERGRAARRAALAAVALGEAPPGAVPATLAPAEGESPDDLRDAAGVVRLRAEEKEREAVEAHGNLRSLTVDLFRKCAHRGSAAYLEAARQVERLHGAIGAAQLALASVGRRDELLSEPEWNGQLTIPGAPSLEALRDIGVVRGSHQRLPVVGGDEGRCRRTAEAAFTLARSEIRELVGEWPLDRRG